MGAINQRLRIYLDSKGVIHEKLASEMGATKQQMSNWLNDTKIPLDKLAIIVRKFIDLNVRWLFTNEGEMIKNEKSTQTSAYSSAKLPQISANDTTQTYSCDNPFCKLQINHLQELNETLRQNLDDLRRRESHLPGEHEGGVPQCSKAV